MKITKYVHSCLMVETDNRTAIFDPGVYSYSAFDIAGLSKLDDIFITHIHGDHAHLPFIKDLVSKFPNVCITTTPQIVKMLEAEGVKAYTDPPAGVSLFEAPHENVSPLFATADTQEVGFHYLDKLSHPGDSHSFNETKDILALPVTAPWGSPVESAALALKLKPKYVLPIHDWHWRDEARRQMYNSFETALSQRGIVMLKPETGLAIELADQ